jgi:hypothetical protein
MPERVYQAADWVPGKGFLLMLRIGVHCINHGTFDPRICLQIYQQSALLVGPSTAHGSGVYAYYPDRVPRSLKGNPFIVFQALPVRERMEIADIHVRGTPFSPDTRFFVLRAAIGTSIRVAVLGFINCQPQQVPVYSGQIYYI